MTAKEHMVISLKGAQQAPAPQLQPEREDREYTPPPPRRNVRQKIEFYKRVAYTIGMLIIIVGGWFAYSAWNPPVDSGNVGGTSEEDAANTEIESLITKVSRLIMLPPGEEPTVATVSDPAKLKDQAFFQNAQVGDKVLIYTKARKAYLYDPEGDILLEVAPITAEGL